MVLFDPVLYTSAPCNVTLCSTNLLAHPYSDDDASKIFETKEL